MRPHSRPPWPGCTVEGDMPIVLGIDVGGSGIKGAPVDIETGDMLEKRYRITTPRPATPSNVIDVAMAVAGHFAWEGPIGLALPAVVQRGVVRTAANIHSSWIDVDARALLEQQTGCPFVVLNDADAAGIAEMRFGAGVEADGVVLMLTFGTGIGSSVFIDGVLVPNTELGHTEFRGGLAEHYAAARLVEDDEMDLHWWASRVNEYLHYIERVLFPDLIIFGGGISKRFADFSDVLQTRARVVPANLRNNAGIVGAAIAGHGAARS